MKKIYRLVTTYTDNTLEVNGYYYQKEKAEEMLNFIMRHSGTNDKWFKMGNISEMEVSDTTEKISDGNEEWMIL